MAVTNESYILEGNNLTLDWDATEDYSFVYENNVLIASLPIGVTTLTVPWVASAVYEILDNSVPTPPANGDPTRDKINLIWSNVPGAVLYEVYLDGQLDSTFEDSGPNVYTYQSPSLSQSIDSAGEVDALAHTITVKSLDQIGNRSILIEFDFPALLPPKPTTDLAVSQPGGPNTFELNWTSPF